MEETVGWERLVKKQDIFSKLNVKIKDSDKLFLWAYSTVLIAGIGKEDDKRTVNYQFFILNREDLSILEKLEGKRKFLADRPKYDGKNFSCETHVRQYVEENF